MCSCSWITQLHMVIREVWEVRFKFKNSSCRIKFTIYHNWHSSRNNHKLLSLAFPIFILKAQEISIFLMNFVRSRVENRLAIWSSYYCSIRICSSPVNLSDIPHSIKCTRNKGVWASCTPEMKLFVKEYQWAWSCILKTRVVKIYKSSRFNQIGVKNEFS